MINPPITAATVRSLMAAAAASWPRRLSSGVIVSSAITKVSNIAIPKPVITTGPSW